MNEEREEGVVLGMETNRIVGLSWGRSTHLSRPGSLGRGELLQVGAKALGLEQQGSQWSWRRVRAGDEGRGGTRWGCGLCRASWQAIGLLLRGNGASLEKRGSDSFASFPLAAVWGAGEGALRDKVRGRKTRGEAAARR